MVPEIPEIVTISVNTPYPGTETWLTEPREIQSRDYRLFDIQHAVLPTTLLPLPEFYEELGEDPAGLEHEAFRLEGVKIHGQDRRWAPMAWGRRIL